MRCLYEVLGVERDANDDDIRKAYRKQALVWHPDKNQHRKEEADAIFKEIQNAYEILGDKHERAWYDSHRDAILKSGQRHQAGGGFEGGEQPDNDLELYTYFSSSCYSGYNDGTKGFYFVYSELFSKIGEEERSVWHDRSDQDGLEEPGPFPEFGTSQSDAKTVSTFYGFWANFTTVKDFKWRDEYNPASAPNRRVRRAMEDENKKLRKTAKREFVETVRELAAFVKKRDKRVAKFQKEAAEKKEAKRIEDEERRRKEREERMKRAQEYEDAAWIVEAENEGGESEEEEEEEEEEEFWCVVCEKRFKSAKALANHERSKKHLQLLAELKRVLEEEEGLDSQDIGEEEEHPPIDTAEPPPNKKSSKKKKKKKVDKAFQNMHMPLDATDLGDDVPSHSGTGVNLEESENEGHSGANVPSSNEDNERDVDDVKGDLGGDEDVGEDELLARLVGGYNQTTTSTSTSNEPVMNLTEEIGLDDISQGIERDEIEVGSSGSQSDDWGQKKPNRKKGKRGGKSQPAKAPSESHGKQKKGKKKNKERSEVVLVCKVCNESFKSRNLLFKHVQEKKHAILKEG